MKVSAKAEYACLAVLELAAHDGSMQPVPVKTIADAHGIPARYLVQILLQLKGAGYVSSMRGASGGYLLACPPEKISLADIMTAIDGPPPIKHKPAGSPRSPVSHALCSVWNDVLATERGMLNSVTFAELMKRLKKPTENMYYI